MTVFVRPRLAPLAVATIGFVASAANAGVQTNILLDNTTGGTHSYAYWYHTEFSNAGGGYSERNAIQFDIDSGYTASLTRLGGYFSGNVKFELLTGTDILDAVANGPLGTDYGDGGAAPTAGESIEYFNFSNVNQTLTAGTYWLVFSSSDTNFDGAIYGGGVNAYSAPQMAGISNVSMLHSAEEGTWNITAPFAILLEGTLNSTAPAVPGPSVALVSAMGLAGIARRRRR